MRAIFTAALAALLSTVVTLPVLAEEPRPIAVFPIELLDTSGEGLKPEQARRLELATRTLVRQLEGTGRYRAVDLEPFADEVAATAPRYACGGCWRDVARKAGADMAVIAAVHKVSTLISTISILIADLETDTYVARADGQFRGETDEAYVRALEFLVPERLRTKDPAVGDQNPG